MTTQTKTRYVVATVPYGEKWPLRWQIKRLSEKGYLKPKNRHRVTLGVWGPDAAPEQGVYFDGLESALQMAVEWDQKAIWICHLDGGKIVDGYCLDLHDDKDSYPTKGKRSNHNIIPRTDYTQFTDCIVH